jgi:hypothetical protein
VFHAQDASRVFSIDKIQLGFVEPVVSSGCSRWHRFHSLYIGGRTALPGWIYKPIVGIVLLYTAYRLVKGTVSAASAHLGKSPLAPALGAGDCQLQDKIDGNPLT